MWSAVHAAQKSPPLPHDPLVLPTMQVPTGLQHPLQLVVSQCQSLQPLASSASALRQRQALKLKRLGGADVVMEAPAHEWWHQRLF
jgi:hypothetical protein